MNFNPWLTQLEEFCGLSDFGEVLINILGPRVVRSSFPEGSISRSDGEIEAHFQFLDAGWVFLSGGRFSEILEVSNPKIESQSLKNYSYPS